MDNEDLEYLEQQAADDEYSAPANVADLCAEVRRLRDERNAAIKQTEHVRNLLRGLVYEASDAHLGEHYGEACNHLGEWPKDNKIESLKQRQNQLEVALLAVAYHIGSPGEFNELTVDDIHRVHELIDAATERALAALDKFDGR